MSGLPKRWVLVQWPDGQPATIEVQGTVTRDVLRQAFALLRNAARRETNAVAFVGSGGES